MANLVEYSVVGLHLHGDLLELAHLVDNAGLDFSSEILRSTLVVLSQGLDA